MERRCNGQQKINAAPPKERTDLCVTRQLLEKPETANVLFGSGIKMDPPISPGRLFDKELANDFSKFITGIFTPEQSCPCRKGK